jgi:hypothetical protein
VFLVRIAVYAGGFESKPELYERLIDLGDSKVSLTFQNSIGECPTDGTQFIDNPKNRVLDSTSSEL